MSVTNAARTILICLLGTNSSLLAQSLSLGAPARLSPPERALGYPSRAADLDVLPGFQNPPPGYGEVPFWWSTIGGVVPVGGLAAGAYLAMLPRSRG